MRTHGINRSTFFKWRSKYGEANVSDVTRLRELEAEHARLKLVYADLALEVDRSLPDLPRHSWGRGGSLPTRFRVAMGTRADDCQGVRRLTGRDSFR